MSEVQRLLLENAQQVVLVCAQGEPYLVGEAMRSLAVLENASLVVGRFDVPFGMYYAASIIMHLSIAKHEKGGEQILTGLSKLKDLSPFGGWPSVIFTLVFGNENTLIPRRDGHIKAIGPADVIRREFSKVSFEERIDCSGKCILPGLVDAHTHPVWAGDRVHEFAMKLAGATYMDIHQAGGGINFTVEHTQKASEEELFNTFRYRLLCMMRAGSTLIECKSGYGLNLETELKMLRVIERARRELDISISSTYCGAHSVPKGKTLMEATDDIVHNHLPKLKELCQRGEIHVDNIDVFCEKGVFDLHSTRRILQGGKAIGLQINFHGDELHPMKAAELGAELGARAISHLEEVSDAGIAAMATGKCSAVLLPTTAYMLRLKQPQARKMLDEGVIVALGSDFNPNAYCFSMSTVMHLACVNMRMSMSEALAAATINAAYALGQSHTHGSLEVGKQGNLIIINSPRWEHLIYQFGGYQELIEYVVAKGKVIYKKDSTNLKGH